jgi:hypothetical protein
MNHEHKHRPHADSTDTLPPIADPTRRPDADGSALGYWLSALPLLLTLLALALLALRLAPAQAQTSDPPVAPPVAPQTVTVTGPTSGAVSETLRLDIRIAPETITVPLTLTVTAPDLDTAEQQIGTSAQIFLTWPTPGTRTITITARNAAGAATTTWTMQIGDAAPPDPIAPQAVTISGPVTGTVDVPLTLTAAITPDTTTLPLTTTWTPQPQTGQGTHTAVYRFAQPGSYPITLTVTNAAGQVRATHSVTIADPAAPLTPPAAVAISGPLTGTVGVPITLTTVVTPTTASSPLTYTWTPAPHTGQQQASAAYVFTHSGAHTVTLTVANPAGQAQTQHRLSIVPAQTPADLTVYLPLVRR